MSLRDKYTDKEWGELADELQKSLNKTKLNQRKGQKFSEHKAPMGKLLKQFPLAFEQVAFRTAFGHERYKDTDADWRNFSRVENPNYDDACIRHFCGIGEENEIEHKAASIWNQLAELQLILEKENG